MKIAIDARSLEGSKTGVGRYLENLLRVWQSRKDVEFVLYFKDAVPEKVFLRGENFSAKVLENPLGFSSNFFFQHFLLPRNLKKDKVDFFFSPFYLRPLFCPVRSAIVLHDISYEAHPEWFDRKEQFVLKALSKISACKADVIFTVSDFSKGEIMKYYHIVADKIVVTPLAPDSNFYFVEDAGKIGALKDKYGLSKFILCVGTMFTRRHVPEIIEAFAEFSGKDNDYQLCVIGKNKTFPFADIDAKIASVNDKAGSARIVRLDSAAEDELMTLYSACEAVIYLSDYEGFGLPVIEAQFFGKPVITSRGTSLVEVGGESVEFVERNEADSIAESFGKVLAGVEYREVLVAGGRENIKRFSWEKCAERTLASILKNI